MRALHRDEILGPQPLHRVETLLEALAEPGAWHAERLELDIAVADAAAEYELAAGQQVKCRELLGEVERLVQRQQDQPADQSQPRRDRRGIGEKRDLLHVFERVRAVMRALDDAVEAERVGSAHQFEVVTQMTGGIARRVLPADDQAELHLLPGAAHSGAMPFSASSFFALSFLSS